jgi:hypothetical protein
MLSISASLTSPVLPRFFVGVRLRFRVRNREIQQLLFRASPYAR